MSWRRGQPYSQDLRDRVLAAVDGGMAVRAVAMLFRVSIAYIYKALIRRRRSGETGARAQRGHLPPKLLAYHEVICVELAKRPDATLEELRAWLLKSHGVSISSAGMWLTLARLGLTLKKSRSTQRSRSAPTSPRRASPGAIYSRC